MMDETLVDWNSIKLENEIKKEVTDDKSDFNDESLQSVESTEEKSDSKNESSTESDDDSVNVIIGNISSFPKKKRSPTKNFIPVEEFDYVDEKPWTTPGADVTDYFNYGFNEETFAAYCARQERLRELVATMDKVQTVCSNLFTNENSRYTGHKSARPPPARKLVSTYTEEYAIEVITSDNRTYTRKNDVEIAPFSETPPDSSDPYNDWTPGIMEPTRDIQWNEPNCVAYDAAPRELVELTPSDHGPIAPPQVTLLPFPMYTYDHPMLSPIVINTSIPPPQFFVPSVPIKPLMWSSENEISDSRSVRSKYEKCHRGSYRSNSRARSRSRTKSHKSRKTKRSDRRKSRSRSRDQRRARDDKR